MVRIKGKVQDVARIGISAMSSIQKLTLLQAVGLMIGILLFQHQIVQFDWNQSGLLFLKPLPPTIYSTNLSEYLPDGILIPASMNWIRVNQSLPLFIIEDQEQRSKTYAGKCSCENIKASIRCCDRPFYLTHKMGFMMIRKIWNITKSFQFVESWVNTTANYIPNTDHRSAFLVRNLYDSILSGYRYHKNGNECWLTIDGESSAEYLLATNRKERRNTYGFKSYLKLPLLYDNETTAIITDVDSTVPVKRYDNNLCEYLQHYNEKEGLKVYIDFAFHTFYSGMLGYWGYTRAIQSMKERTTYVCYKDMLSVDHDLQTFNNVLGFLYNMTDYKWELQSNLRPGGPIQYTGGHSTSIHASKNETKYLLSLINELDREVFNNEIAWMNSVLPCQ